MKVLNIEEQEQLNHKLAPTKAAKRTEIESKVRRSKESQVNLGRKTSSWETSTAIQ